MFRSQDPRRCVDLVVALGPGREVRKFEGSGSVVGGKLATVQNETSKGDEVIN